MKSLIYIFGIFILTATTWAKNDLPSWQETESAKRIIQFVDAVTDKQSPDYLAEEGRVAVFDNDGTLWSEQPLYFQALFIFDRVKALAPEHPEWKTEEPFASVLKGDFKAALAGGEAALIQLTMATHSGMSVEQFRDEVKDWISTARHPQTGKLYTEMVFQPMLEMLDYLSANGFKTYIVSGGGIEFMRPWAEQVYGIPPEQVIGSSIKTSYKIVDGKPILMRKPELNFINDKSGKPVGINHHIGRRPVLAFGNSDGDFQMLEWTTAGPGKRLGVLIHHDDAKREWAYDRDSHIGKLQRGLDEGPEKGWIIVSMKNDWKRIYPSKQ